MRLAWIGAGGLFAVIALAGNGCSPSASSEESAPTGVASQAIQGGSIDSTSTFAVGICAEGGTLNSSCFGSTCSGALILPNVVATARHCVDQTPPQVDCSTGNPTFGSRRGQLRVTTNTTMAAAPSGWYAVSGVAVPDDDHVCGNDIALLVLSQSIPASVAKPVIPGVQYLMWDPDHYTPSFVGIGFGITSPSSDDSGTRRRSKPISVLCIPGSPDLPCPAGWNANEFVGGDGVCSGDSGSSAFEADSLQKGAPVSFGVLSRGGENEARTKCEFSAYTRFDAHRDFVLKVAKEASNDWKLYPEPSWTAYKPPATPKPKDAGAPKNDDSSKAADLGEDCRKNKDCKSKLCADLGDGTFACTQSCDEAAESSCPDGFECRENLCLAADPTPAPVPAAPTTTTTTTTGCAAAPGSSALSWSTAIFGAAAVLGAVRRRKRESSFDPLR